MFNFPRPIFILFHQISRLLKTLPPRHRVCWLLPVAEAWAAVLIAGFFAGEANACFSMGLPGWCEGAATLLA
jgi:hypothetical protein